MINKSIIQYSYVKESNNLKATNKSDKKNSDASSWRKGSNCSNFGSAHKNSAVLSDKKNSDFKRNRFNSDGNNNNQKYKNYNNEDYLEEIEIDMNTIKYSLNSTITFT